MLSAITLIVIILFAVLSNPFPEVIKNSGPEADEMALKIQTVLHFKEYAETRFIEWSFRNGKNSYIWDREKHRVVVKWDNNHVNLDLKNPGLSKVFKNNLGVSGGQKEKLINKATNNYNNDSFWLVAPFKLFDPGTERNLATLDDSSKGLLVTYTSGGDTPGDSYLWKLNSNGFPESYRMWVSIIPIGGLKASWEDWQKMDSGTYLPTAHKIGPITLSMGKVKAYN